MDGRFGRRGLVGLGSRELWFRGAIWKERTERGRQRGWKNNIWLRLNMLTSHPTSIGHVRVAIKIKQMAK